MNEADRFHLLGTYRTPRFKYGDVATCAIRGQVKIVGLSNGRIQWPKCRSGKRSRAIIVYGALADAVRTESVRGVAYWFRIGRDTVWKWRVARQDERRRPGPPAAVLGDVGARSAAEAKDCAICVVNVRQSQLRGEVANGGISQGG